MPAGELEQLRIDVNREREARLGKTNQVREAVASDTAGLPCPPMSERLTLDNVETAFTYHPWNLDQKDDGDQVREALITAAKTILRNVPESPTRTRALNCLVDARMLANAAITHRGRF